MAQINKSTDYFDISTWTATTSAISNLGFSPDWVWIKSTDSANGHILFDTIRGANERLSSASSAAESTRTDELMSFDSNGYTLGSSGNTNDTNPFNASYVGWSWRGSDSSAVSNTDGSITSTVSANTTSGFSIVSYTGTGSASTIGHGLNSTLSTIILKNRDDGSVFWYVFHKSLGNNSELYLNGTDSAPGSTGAWNTTSPTSSVFSVGSHGGTNASGQNIIAYCFAEKKGFSKAFSFTGNGSSDGSYCHLGFKPSFILGKNSDNASENWFIFDNKRDTFNTSYHQLFPNSSTTEGTNSAQNIDILSNGFKCRSAETRFNGSGNKIIGIAFAENPFVTSTGIPTTAR